MKPYVLIFWSHDNMHAWKREHFRAINLMVVDDTHIVASLNKRQLADALNNVRISSVRSAETAEIVR